MFCPDLFLFLKIFERHQKHPETFALVFSEVFVVHLMGSSYCSCIPVVGISEQLEALVNKNVVNQEIG